MARGFENVFLDYFGLRQVKALKNVWQELFTKTKNGETETKELLPT